MSKTRQTDAAPEANDGYVLESREKSELDRLGFQHEVWRAEADLFLDRSGVDEGRAALDLGCGPGYLSMDLVARVGPDGFVMAIDRSAFFIDHLKTWARESGVDNLEAFEGDLLDADLPEGRFDVVVCRWVLMFLADPEGIIRKARRALAPGGTLAVMEYYPFLDIALSPPSPAFDRVYRAVADLIASFGGDADVGGRVPGMMRESGFDQVECESISRSAGPGSPLWKWIEATGRNHTNLVAQELITSDELSAYETAMADARSREDAVFTAPTVAITIGRKR